MNVAGRQWALVLAAGEGTRLASLTRDRAGLSVPKQYCSLDGGRSLLQQALDRAARVVPRERVVTVVAAQHRRWWERELGAGRAIVQPHNRGTAAGVLLPLLAILERDPQARIVFLPSDHHVADEAVLTRAIERALRQLERRPSEVVLLGITPEEHDAEFGWIVPETSGSPFATRVRRFVEKPPPAAVPELLDRGALWNSFIFAATLPSVLALYERRLPRLLEALSDAVAGGQLALERLYEGLASHDFSRDLLQGAEDVLAVLAVPSCGWNDLGTPDRVVRCLRRPPAPRGSWPALAGSVARVNLARAVSAG